MNINKRVNRADTRQLGWAGVILMILFLTAGCGSSGDNGGGGPPITPPSTGGSYAASTYLLYAVSVDATGSLSALDPATPALPITVETGSDIVMDEDDHNIFDPNSYGMYQSGTYNSTTKTVTNLHPHAVIYAKTDGKLYRVSALKSGSPTPVQVSSESGADLLCVGTVEGFMGTPVSDFANPDNSQYIYVLPGVDSNCNTEDDEWKMVRLGMSASDTPVSAKPIIEMLLDLNTGAITGWLVIDAGELKKCNANFTACGTTLMLVTSEVNEMLALGSNRSLLNIDDQLFVYDGDANTLSDPIFTIPLGAGVIASAADDNHLYFAHEQTIYKAPIDGSDLASELAIESGYIGFLMAVTANKVVYTAGANWFMTSSLKVADKATGEITELDTAGTDGIASFFVAGNNIYYNSYNLNREPTAGVINEAGGGQSETPDAAWSGSILSTSTDLSKNDSTPALADLIEHFEHHRVYFAGHDAGARLYRW